MTCKTTRSKKIARLCRLFIVMLFAILPNSVFAAGIYNNDTKPHRVEIKDENGKHYFLRISTASTHYVDCRYGCLIRVVETNHTKTVSSNTDIVISDGEVRVR